MVLVIRESDNRGRYTVECDKSVVIGKDSYISGI